MLDFKKILIANRGEIAVRIIRALREMDIRAVAVYSDADRASRYVRMADEAAHLGPAPSAESYLRIDRIIEAARRHDAAAIHPGYGFLSENAELAGACEAAGIVFIGPSASAIRKMGSKTSARRVAQEAGVPVVPGTERGVSSIDDARDIAGLCGYPIMLKAAAGGGGMGMRRVDSAADLEAALRDASSEAQGAFGSAEIYVEKLIENPRHIEIQILGDQHGTLLHLGERECSIQRRRQKVIEECPSPLVASHPEMRARMGEAAVRVARAAGYYNAGTVEFLVDPDRNFFFLEMNTRLQVEHPVTELVTGLDLVKLQIRIAAGERLSLTQEDITWKGAAIECRVYAEDPDDNFFPSPGKITRLAEPAGPGVRLDSGVYEGFTVPVDYDPLLAKLAVWAETREAAVARMSRALDEYHIDGIRTNLSFFRRVARDLEFRQGRLSTGFIEAFLARSAPVEASDEELRAVVALVAALHSHQEVPRGAEVNHSRWRSEGREQLFR
jgi:acetyl-CoA carboxylase, biotin carboxylase subunit